MRRWIGLAALISGFSAVTALAHPGHGSTPPDSAEHYVAEPVHAVWIVAGFVAVVLTGIWLTRRAGLTRIRARKNRLPPE